MVDSPNSIRTLLYEQWDKHVGAWRTLDPLYIWSAVLGLFGAFILIAIAALMKARHVH